MRFKYTMWSWDFNIRHWIIVVLIISYVGNKSSSAAFEKFKGSIGCPPFEFLCLDGECLPEQKHCDGHPDCIDGTDEHNCDMLKCLPPNYFPCENGHCVGDTLLCDGDDDCGDWSDEKNCQDLSDTHPTTCSALEFQCLDRLCVPQKWVCDGKPDCIDSSDETLGCSLNISCENEFKCKNHFCIPTEFHCDGANDCGDNSDELNCPRREVPIEDCLLDRGMFRCHDGEICIELFEVCNGKLDCLDGSDEGALCNSKDVCANSSCPHHCYPSPSGALCTCPRGMINDGHTCIDINECEQFGICDHSCVNLPGTYQCLCAPGYTLAVDKRSCKAQGPEGLMLFSSQRQIRAYFLSSEVYYTVAKDLNQVTGVAYDGQHVYWTNVYHGEESITRSLEDGSNMEVIVTAGLGTPEDLALDWITKNIYFTDSKFRHVGVCSNTGTVCTILHNKDIHKPRDICLSPIQGTMYWSDWGDRPLIAHSGMDGSGFTEFVTKDLHWPNGLTIDHGNDRLYWVDAKLLVIESIKLDGSGRRVVLSEFINHPYAIAVFESSIYWSDWTGQEIQKCNKFTGKDRKTVIREKNNRVYGVHIYHPAQMNTSVGNPCIEAGCSDLCLLAPVSSPLRYSCACPQDKIMAPNNHFCEQIMKRYSLLVGAGSDLLEVEHQRLGSITTNKIKLKGVYKIGALAYDAVSGSVIISDAADKKIVSLSRQTEEVTVLLSDGVGKLEGMDVDPYGHNLYWADSERQTVEVFSLNTHERKTLLRDLGGDTPLDVALAPDEGYMFVALMGPKMVHIDRFNMDGDLKSRVHIADHNVLGPNVALTYDKAIGHVIWSDSGSGNIEAVDIDGMKRTKVRELYKTPIDIAVIEDDIFWTNHGSATLLWMNKYDSEDDSSKQLPLGQQLTLGLENVRLAAVTGLISGHEHPCLENNGGCSHICLSTPNKPVCACPFGMILRADSTTCELASHCRIGNYRCSTGECIPIAMQCNHHADCPHGDDELDCKAFTLACVRGMYSCHDGEKCLDHATKCDGNADCRDGSDEMNCEASATCKPGEFQCKSGPCIPMSWRCDDTKDCDDGSDEGDQVCVLTTCHSENEFRCTSGTCIPSNWECDGSPDCTDASDEHEDCLRRSSCAPDQLTCDNGHCVDRGLACDGHDDCEDNSDESGCPSTQRPELEVAVHVSDNGKTPDKQRPQCDDTQFTCNICLPADARCNGTAECLRGEDETGCDGCQENQFQCTESGHCVPRDWLCDGAKDCNDNSDEDPGLCQFHKKGATKPFNRGKSECIEFTCRDLKCLPFSKVCDGHPDCEDKSDEGGRCGRGCATAGCMDSCQETPSGPQCSCFPGYQLTGDSKTCVDVDECMLGVYCSQFCHNNPGSFTCSCRYPEYQLRDNRMTCKAKGQEMQIVYAIDNEIRFVTKSHASLGVVHRSEFVNFHVSGLDVDAHSRCIYWSSDLIGTVNRKCMTNKTAIATLSKLVRPGKIAVDWLTENVYFIERDHVIKVCHFEARKCSVVITAEPEVTINSLAVDPNKNLLFWSESLGLGQTKSIIKRATMAGTAIAVVLDLGVLGLVDLTLDSLHQLIYWVDADHRQVQRISYNGTNKQTMFDSPDGPVKVALFEHSVYWMVEARTTLRSQHLDTYGNVWQCAVSGPSAWRCDGLKVHPRTIPATPYTFAIMQEASQPLGANECVGQCSHVCVTGGICLCPNGTRVRANQPCGDSGSGPAQFSTKIIHAPEGTSTLWTVFKVFIMLFIIVPTIVGIMFVLRYDIQTLFHSCLSAASKPVFSNIHFNNPTYDMSSSHLETAFHPNRLNPGEHQYENPVVFDNVSDGTVSTITNEINEPSKKLKVIEFHVNDCKDDDSLRSMEYSEATGDSHKAPLIR